MFNLKLVDKLQYQIDWEGKPEPERSNHMDWISWKHANFPEISLKDVVHMAYEERENNE